MEGILTGRRLAAALLLMAVPLLAATLLLLVQAQLPLGMELPLRGTSLIILLAAPGAFGASLLVWRMLVRLLVAGLYLAVTFVVIVVYSLSLGCYLGIDCL